MPRIPIGHRLLGVVVLASVLSAASQPDAARAGSRSTDPTATESVRALLSSACRCAGTKSHGRYLRCAKDVVDDALRGEGGSRCTDATAVEHVRAVVSSACEGVGARAHGRCAKGIVRAALRAGPLPRPLPSPVAVRQEPEGVTLGDPAFAALPGARADFGRLGGAVYRIEVPERWNGRLVLFMHGYEELRPQAQVSAPDIRTDLILRGYAWGASSFSSTSWIPGRSADETAALWDYFAQKYGRPCWTYVTGISMGGAASHIAAERYPERFDGSLALCGSAGFVEGAMELADYFAAGAFVAGITQAEIDASTDAARLIPNRILPALQAPAAHEQFENIVLDLTGGPRAFDREGFRLEEETNWSRAQLLVALRVAPNAGTVYRLGPLSALSSDEFNRAAIRLPTNDALLRSLAEGNETTGALAMPLLSLYATGDGQVPIEQASILRRRVDAAAKGERLVQRVFRDPSHCGFSNAEQEASFEALEGWVEHGVRPDGQDVLVDDLRTLSGQFELSPRPGTPEADAVPGAADRVLVHGGLTLDGAPFDARFLGAIVRRGGLVTPCQYTLTSVDSGRYEIKVLADAEASGCGAPAAEILLWTFARSQRLFSRESLPWPGDGATATFDASFSVSAPDGGAPPTTDFIGEVFRRDGERLPPGTRIEAYAGDVRCGVASTRRTGNYSGYILSVVGSESVAGCDREGKLTFRIDGQRATGTPGGGHTLDLILRRGARSRGACSRR
jgi:pimeloyl-ACP methyl ester carboxylesterase